MNRKQRVLTVIALVAFVAIGACAYLEWPPVRMGDTPYLLFAGKSPYGGSTGIIPSAWIPWFMLGVVYAALFFLLADRKEKR